ncbi:hypothetical protein BDR04DRAFT_1098227 [Suillus decipiens]|nr:hypothetical protein BDR04DRAFT_1098227 [Suillus decipiens]
MMVVGPLYRTSSRKAKVICVRPYEQRMIHEQALDEQQIHAGHFDLPLNCLSQSTKSSAASPLRDKG